MVKILNVLGIAPVAAWFLDEPQQWLAGLIPSYWPMKMLWLAAAHRRWTPYALIGMLVSVAVLQLLLTLFRRRTR